MEQRKRKEEKQNRKENRFHRIKDHEEHRQSKAGLKNEGILYDHAYSSEERLERGGCALLEGKGLDRTGASMEEKQKRRIT